MADEQEPTLEVPAEEPAKREDTKPIKVAARRRAKSSAPSASKVVVAEGKSITCSRAHGIRGPGEEITADLFTDGQAAVDALLEKGYLVKT